MSGTVVVVGSLHHDTMIAAPRLPVLGETLPGTYRAGKCGGKGGNQAVEAARHGAAVTMIGCVGDDAAGGALRANLARAGVDVARVRVEAGASGASVAIATADGDYAAVIVTGTNARLGADDVAGAAALLRPGAVLVLQNEIPPAVNEAAARAARQAGATIVLNAAPARAPAAAMLADVDVLVVNAVEAAMLGAAPVGDLAGAAVAATHLAGLCRTAIVTAGGDGLAFAGPDGAGRLPAHPVALRSTHGAGDAFVGALAARFAAGDTLGSAVRYANAAAAALVSTAEGERAGLAPGQTWALLGATASTCGHSGGL